MDKKDKIMSKQPSIDIVDDLRAPADVAAVLGDIQATLEIPWAPANWRAYAMYPKAMRLFWERLKPAVNTREFLQAALAIPERAYQTVGQWYRPSHRMDVLAEEQERIGKELDA